MPTTVRNPNTPVNDGKPIRVIGKMTKPLEELVSKAGKKYFRAKVVVDDNFGGPASWIDVTMFEDLVSKIPDELLKAGSYCKFVGKGSTHEWTAKDGTVRTGKDLICSAVELQNGAFITGKQDKEPGENEDAF